VRDGPGRIPSGMVGYAQVMGAATLWATLGLFYTGFIDVYGVPPLGVAFYRASFGFAVLLLVLAIGRLARLWVAARDLPFFALFGLVGVAVFYITYVYAIHLAGMAVAVVLMYTAPAWVSLIAWRLFDEGLGRYKLMALGLAFVGCALVARVCDPSQVRLNLMGVLCGLGAGLTYGLYTVFNKVAVRRRYSPWTVMLYALGFGALFLLPLQSAAVFRPLRQPALIFWLLMLAIGPTLGAALMHTMSLQRLPASVVSIVATLEPAIATVLAWLFLGERLGGDQILGGALILAGVLVLQWADREPQSIVEPAQGL
jgi:DME family drug/metabolite transporter